MENTALLIIDVQNDYFKGGRMTLVGAEEGKKCTTGSGIFQKKIIFRLFTSSILQQMMVQLSFTRYRRC